MIGHIVLALLAAAPCPPQAPVELEGRALGAVRLACTSWLLTDSGLARVGAQESVEQLELAADAVVEGVTLLTAPGESQLIFGFRGASSAGAKLTAFLRDLKYSPAVSKPWDARGQ